MPKPIAVLISDIHYSLATLTVADAALRMAIKVANDLKVMLVVSGDLHDSKANMRAECVNTLIETFKLCDSPPAVLRGNHDACNERSKEHALNFLAPYAMIVDEPKYIHPIGHFIPYFHDPDELREHLKTLPRGATVIMHQGLTSTNAGDYIQDKSAINPEDVAGLRVISGHYHTRQTTKLPNGGVWDYVGNPYTLTFGEANDPPKGFQILMSDVSLEFIPTNLRKHVVIEYDLTTDESKWSAGPINYGGGIQDIVWVRVRGRREQLSKFNKDMWCREKGIPRSVRLDLIPIDSPIQVTNTHLNLTGGTLLDSLIDALPDTDDDNKIRLKRLWKDLA